MKLLVLQAEDGIDITGFTKGEEVTITNLGAASAVGILAIIMEAVDPPGIDGLYEITKAE